VTQVRARLASSIDASSYDTRRAMTEGPPIPIAAPLLSTRELAFVTQAIETGWISSAGPFIGEFETQFAAKVGIARAEAVANGTTVLNVVLHAIGIASANPSSPAEAHIPSIPLNLRLRYDSDLGGNR